MALADSVWAFLYSLSSPINLLIVSDSNEIAKQFSVHLRKTGFRIVQIEDLPEARRLYERQRPDIIVMSLRVIVWVLLYLFEHTSKDFQSEILLVA